VDVSEYGWAYTIVSAVVYYVLSDMLAYWFHRALHIKPLFRHIHRFHHSFVATSPWVVTAMHPAEMVILQSSAFIPLFIIPLHVVPVAAVLIYALVFNIIDHSGVRLTSRIPWQGPSMYHDDHHAHFHCNFGQHLQIWDRIHGTLRRVNRRYGEDIYGGKGEGDSFGEFVKYP
jgi:lathosterol oxidase